ncbi:MULTISPECIES: ArsR/SmtB family transcription factor [Filomicrobium]|uniref:ArsR family transcriptional regulator n=2 Tax=Filomicrobium TaxID=119044 RepID=A0A0D6JI54_9HYPH|nr:MULTISPECIES: metalloregulator ArsR/SmtB family transcription factor [Filomicrobium]CPR21477.1 ArsR family transcriptional regulator [Candidatus Filomicrobium marinum]
MTYKDIFISIAVMNDLSPTRLPLATSQMVIALKAAAEPTRLRILLLLTSGELNVKDLTQILGQSQPRLSRHLKLLVEAGLIERIREGSWVYFHLSDRTANGRLASVLLAMADLNDPIVIRDRERAEHLKRDREAIAQQYFERHASDWDQIRSLHVAEAEVEAAMSEALGPAPIEFLVDLGTGTGRTLELLAERYQRAVGIDINQAMLAYARSKIDNAGLRNAQVRHGDIYNLALMPDEADVVVMHQILHYLSDPQRALDEAARILRPGGRLLIVDFAPHELEFLRDHAHERLGIGTDTMTNWLADSGLKPVTTRHLPPSPQHGDKTDNLTVSLWLAEKSEAA